MRRSLVEMTPAPTGQSGLADALVEVGRLSGSSMHPRPAAEARDREGRHVSEVSESSDTSETSPRKGLAPSL